MMWAGYFLYDEGRIIAHYTGRATDGLCHAYRNLDVPTGFFLNASAIGAFPKPEQAKQACEKAVGL